MKKCSLITQLCVLFFATTLKTLALTSFVEDLDKYMRNVAVLTSYLMDNEYKVRTDDPLFLFKSQEEKDICIENIFNTWRLLNLHAMNAYREAPEHLCSEIKSTDSHFLRFIKKNPSKACINNRLNTKIINDLATKMDRTALCFGVQDVTEDSICKYAIPPAYEEVKKFWNQYAQEISITVSQMQ